MKKFNSFKYNNDIVKLSNALTNNKKYLLDFYNKNLLFCPKCGKAKLKFNSGTSKRAAFLSTKQSSVSDRNSHTKECPFSYKKITVHTKKEFYDRLTRNQIKDKVTMIFNNYLNKKSNFINYEENIIDNGNIKDIKSKSRHQTNKRLPRYKIEHFYNTPKYVYGVPVLYHGIVKLSSKIAKNKHGESYYQISIYNKDNDKLIRFFNKHTLENPIIDKELYIIVLIAVLSENEKGQIKSKLYHQTFEYIKYQQK